MLSDPTKPDPYRQYPTIPAIPQTKSISQEHRTISVACRDALTICPNSIYAQASGITPTPPTLEEMERFAKLAPAFCVLKSEKHDREAVQRAIDVAKADTVDAAELEPLIAHAEARLKSFKPQVRSSTTCPRTDHVWWL